MSDLFLVYINKKSILYIPLIFLYINLIKLNATYKIFLDSNYEIWRSKKKHFLCM